MLSSLFARRYLFSRKSHSVINVISGVSALAVSVPVAAMVILLSVFNGLEGMVRQMYTEFDPDVMVSPSHGKTFAADSALSARLRSVDGVAAFSYLIEENAMVEYRGGQYIATLRGVDSLYGSVVPMEKMMVDGDFSLHFGEIEQAVVGRGMAYSLGIGTTGYDYLNVYAPRRGSFNPILPMDAYRTDRLLPASIFALDAETDSKYLIAPLDFARRLFDYPGQATGIAVRLTPGADPDRSAAKIAAELGDDFRALTRYQQKASLYRIMQYEKWGIFMICALVMVIASFSLIGSLVMLIIDKRGDVRTLLTLGATVRTVRAIFTREGMLLASAGAAAGLAVGVGFCLLQQRYGLITIPADTFLTDTYPVILRPGDLLAVAAAFIVTAAVIVRSTVAGMIPKSMIRL